jgi:predicted nuclease with TOPRIM domain
MPGRTNTERIEELSRELTALVERGDNLRDRTTNLETEVAAIRRSLATIETRLALIEDKLNQFKSTSEESSRRRWTFLIAFFGAVIGAALTFLTNLAIAYFRK